MYACKIILKGGYPPSPMANRLSQKVVCDLSGVAGISWQM